MQTKTHAVAAATALILCLTSVAVTADDQLARFFFAEAKTRERQHYYHDAIMFYKKVLEQAPRSELANRAQQRITQLRATPEMVADAKKDAERKRKEDEARQAAKRRLEEYVEAHAEFGPQILAHKITIGMSQDDVTASWGKPDQVNTTVTALGSHEQWVYGSTYVYFSDGRLTSWQTTR